MSGYPAQLANELPLLRIAQLVLPQKRQWTQFRHHVVIDEDPGSFPKRRSAYAFYKRNAHVVLASTDVDYHHAAGVKGGSERILD